MSIEVRPFAAALEAEWDTFAAGCVNATLLHTRRFLNYHGSRFADRSLCIYEGGRLAGLLPAAEARGDAGEVASHPGATYGGIVHQGRLKGEAMLQALEAAVAHYRGQGCRRFVYKPVPHIYARVPAQDDLYALFRLGARRFRCDLACSIDLAGTRQVSDRRRRSLKKAQKLVTLDGGSQLLPQAWAVLEDNLGRKHGAVPTHSLAEMELLAGLFPREIQVRCARLAGRVEAAVVLFATPRAWHAQYIASSEAGYEASALDALFDAAIAEAAAAGARYFDFGTSNEQAGLVLNAGLYGFKSEFGGGGVAHEHYEI